MQTDIYNALILHGNIPGEKMVAALREATNRKEQSTVKK